MEIVTPNLTNSETNSSTSTPDSGASSAKDLQTLHCKMDIPPLPRLEDSDAKDNAPENTLTVGQEFYLDCESDGLAVLKSAQVEPAASLGPMAPYYLKILETHPQQGSKVQFVMTSYKVGNHQIKDVVIRGESEVDGKLQEHHFKVENISLNVVTTIEKQEGAQAVQQEPYGPYGPFIGHLPRSFWFTLFGVILFVVVLGVYKLRSFLQRKRFLDDLAKNESSLTPIAELSQKIRKVLKHEMFAGDVSKNLINPSVMQEVTQDLEQALRLFLARNFRIPAQTWSFKEIIKGIKKYHRKMFPDLKEELESLFKELEHMKADVSKLQVKDCLQLTHHIRKFGDHVNRLNLNIDRPSSLKDKKVKLQDAQKEGVL